MKTVMIPNILLPAVRDLSAWAVIACDQYTSDGEYWRNLKAFVGDKPSTLNLIYPEIYLDHDRESRIARINENMRSYITRGYFKPYTGLILVERTTESGTRTGIMLSIDLEDYSFENGAHSLIRSTEATIAERIPPRVEIRRNAPIELPHIMLLYDDREGKVLSSVSRGRTLYDFDLNMGGGHIKGTAVNNPEEVITNLYSLADISECKRKYGVEESILFLVGDGNHSLAAAKACWDELKATLPESEREDHPARYALVEVVNLYDEALAFEPINRFVKTDKPDLFIKNLNLGGDGKVVAVVGGLRGAVHFPEDIREGIRALDDYIAQFIAQNGGSVDYVHGTEESMALSSEGVCILLPAMAKSDLFRLVTEGGNLPRKTFSMGEANEKRYYLEAKIIR